MAYSGIGGQAVMEGVMMKYKDRYAVAVRKPDHEIIVEKRIYQGICKSERLRNLIFIRGIINFVESMVLFFKTHTKMEDAQIQRHPPLVEPNHLQSIRYIVQLLIDYLCHISD